MGCTPLFAPLTTVIGRSPTFGAFVLSSTALLCKWSHHCSSTRLPRKVDMSILDVMAVSLIPVLTLLLVGYSPDFADSGRGNSSIRALFVLSSPVIVADVSIFACFYLRHLLARYRGEVHLHGDGLCARIAVTRFGQSGRDQTKYTQAMCTAVGIH